MKNRNYPPALAGLLAFLSRFSRLKRWKYQTGIHEI